MIFSMFVTSIFHLGSSHLSTSIDQQHAFSMNQDLLQKLASIQDLNDIYDQVRGNDRLFLEKIQNLFNDLEKENVTPNKPSTLTLQSQMMLARNLTHTFTNPDQMKKK